MLTMEPALAAVIGALVAARDIWEKLGSVSALISGVLVAIIGAIATYVYNSRQAKAQAQQADREVAVQRVQTVATFMPYLHSVNPREKAAALLAISALGDPELAANLASTIRDEGSVDALTRMAASPDAPAAAAARQSLEAIYAMLRGSVVKVIGPDGNEEHPRGSGFAISDRMILTTDFVPAHADSLEVEMSDAQRVPCRVLAIQPQNGVAVLEPGHPGPPALALARAGLGDPEEDLVLLGFGLTGWSASRGRVVGMTEFPVGHEDGRVLTMLRTSLRSEPGHAGAPVVNRTGDVVGILYGRDVKSGEAVVLPVDVVRAGLQDLELAFDRHST